MELLAPNPTPALTASDPRTAKTASTRFLLELARALHSAGAPSYRLEDALSACARRWGEEAEFFSTPTSIFAAFGHGADQRTYLLRVRPGDADLGRLSELDELMEEVARGKATPDEGLRRLEQIENASPRYSKRLGTLACAAVSGTVALFFGGGVLELVVSAVLGAIVGALGQLFARFSRNGLFEPTAAFVAALLSVLLAWLLPGLSDRVTTLAALILLVPGLTLTVGLAEVSMTHWSSGTARLAGASAVFLSIALGVALGRRISVVLPGFASSDAPGSPSFAAMMVALVIAPLAFTVLFQARRRDSGWILLIGALGFFASRFGAFVVGPELGAFFGALAVGVGSNVFARACRRPASVLQVPGLLLLVPGSIGFESLSSFLAQDVLEGVDAAFRMLFVGAALVGGLLLSNALVSPERSL